jgi:hypothetical protein
MKLTDSTLILSFILLSACSDHSTVRSPSSRVERNSPLGRRELMEQRMEESFKRDNERHKKIGTPPTVKVD